MIKAVVTDIEGTTSSLSFVKDVLFPYARDHIASFVRTHADDPAVVEQLAAVAHEAGRELTLHETIDQLIAWIDADRKITPLKTLQGMIWEAGYRDGAFTGHVYPDAVEQLRRWHAAGVALYVYSSGSVHAQRLLFAHTTFGDLTPLFRDYFDTRIGAKVDTASYAAIAGQIGLPAGEILFLSDIEAELDAAGAAGMKTCQLVRDADLAATPRHRQVRDFHDIPVA